MKWTLFGDAKRSNRPSLRSRGSLLIHWNEDTAVVFDPVKQKFFKDSVASIQAEGSACLSFRHELMLIAIIEQSVPYQKIEIPRYDNSFDCYAKAKNADQKVFLGTIDLSKLGKTINLHRARGHIPYLYIIGNVEVPT
jgi:hypothetical protein